MKIKVGRTTNEAEFFDDDGNSLKLLVAEAHIHLHPGEMTKVDMVVYVDEADIEVDDDYLTTERWRKRHEPEAIY